jgi:dTDP-4-dehydrorhamnose 3,5-epimerase
LPRTVDSRLIPEEVVINTLTQHGDSRGVLSEIYRADHSPAPMVQWNIVRSEAGVMRGVHLHPTHADTLFVIEGTMILGLHDMRPEDPSKRLSTFVTLRGGVPQTVYVPAGVCHGFWFPEPTVYVYGLSGCWSMANDLGCRYDAPELGLDWGLSDPILSERDADPTDYATMREAFFAARPDLRGR